jgi:hypothetical protein
MKTKDIETVDVKQLRELVDQLPEGTILSVNLGEVADGQKDGRIHEILQKPDFFRKRKD